MSDALCGPSNPLQQFKQQTQLDRSLQQDRLTSRQPPGQGFRSQDPRAGLLDPEFEAFQAGAAPIDLPQLQHHNHSQGAFQHRYAGPSQGPSWAADFQNLNISPGYPSQSYQSHHAGRSTAGWAQGFQQQLAQQAPRAPGTTTTPQAFQQRARYGMNGFQSAFPQPTAVQGSGMESKAPLNEQFDDAAFERAFNQASDEMMPDAAEALGERTLSIPDPANIAAMIQDAEVKGLRGGPYLPMLRMLLVDSLQEDQMSKPRILQIARLVSTVDPAEISWMQRALTVPVLEHVLKRDIQWDTTGQAEGTLIALLNSYKAMNARLPTEQQTTAHVLSGNYADLLPRRLETRSIPAAPDMPAYMQLDLNRDGDIESQLFDGNNGLARAFETQLLPEHLVENEIVRFETALTFSELLHEQDDTLRERMGGLNAQQARSHLLAVTQGACRGSAMYQRQLAERPPVAEPIAIDAEEPLTADALQPKEVSTEQQRQEIPQKADDDALAETAGELLEKVKHNKSEKFQNSQFLGLMRKLRDRETKVEGDKMVETNSTSSGARNESLNASASIDAPYFDNSEQRPTPLRTLSPFANFDTRRRPENFIPPQEQDHDAGRVDPRDGQEVVNLLNQPGNGEAGNDIGTSDTMPPEAVSHPRWWKRETTLPEMLYGPGGTLEAPQH